MSGAIDRHAIVAPPEMTCHARQPDMIGFVIQSLYVLCLIIWLYLGNYLQV